jgi:hypothetical protein
MRLPTRDELLSFFRDDPPLALEYIEILGDERELRIARFLPLAGQIDILRDILSRTVQTRH